MCQIDVLQRLKCERHIVEKALKNLPKTLDETYDAILLAMPQEELVIVNHILQWISYHNELHNGEGIPCEILIQAVGESTAELAVDGLERFYDNDTLRELCGCLIKIVSEEKVELNIGLRRTTLTASFAHYTVREYLDSSRPKNSIVSFTVRQEGLRQKFLGIILSEAQHIESNELWELKNASVDPSDALGVVYRSLSVYSVVSAILSLYEWPTEISQHDMLCAMAIELLDPSKPHFESLKCAASSIDVSLPFFSANILHAGTQFWHIQWHPETSNMAAVNLLHLLLLAEEVSKCLLFAEKFLQAKDTRDFLQARLRFERQVWVTLEDCAESYLLDGSIIEIYAQIEAANARSFKLLLDYGAGLFDCSKILLLHISSHKHDPEYGCQGDCQLRRLLELGADPTSRSCRITPLQIAVISGDLDGVSILLDAGADPNDTGSSEGTLWEDGTLMSRFNHLDGASALNICRKFGSDLDESQDRLWRDPNFEKIEGILLRYRAQDFLRA